MEAIADPTDEQDEVTVTERQVVEREDPKIFAFDPTIRLDDGSTPPIEQYLHRAIGKALGKGFSSFAGGTSFDFDTGLSDEAYEITVQRSTVALEAMYADLERQDAQSPNVGADV
jgi:hypothetical protein